MAIIQLDATLVTCQAEINAKVGDLLLVYGGHCLGVYRGVTKWPADAAKAPVNGWVKPFTDFADRDVLAAITTGPKNSMQIGDHMRLSRTDTRSRAHISYFVKQLAARGVIRALPGTRRNHTYELAPRHDDQR